MSVCVSASLFTFSPEGRLNTITLLWFPLTGKRHQQSAPVSAEAKHRHTHSPVSLSPSNIILFLWLLRFFHYHLNLLVIIHYSIAIPFVLFLFFLLSVSSVIPMCPTVSLGLVSLSCVFSQRLGSRKDSDATLQVAVTLLRWMVYAGDRGVCLFLCRFNVPVKGLLGSRNVGTEKGGKTRFWGCEGVKSAGGCDSGSCSSLAALSTLRRQQQVRPYAGSNLPASSVWVFFWIGFVFRKTRRQTGTKLGTQTS